MKLRLRLTVATLAVTVPMVLALVVVDARARQHAAEDELRALVLDRLGLASERERCEQGRLDEAPPGPRPPLPHPSPSWGHHREPARLFGYDEQGRAHEADAPALVAAEVRGLAAGQSLSRSTLWNAGEVEIVVRTPWGQGACAYVVARGTKEPWLGAVLPPTRVWLLPVIVLFGAVVISVGPVVRRLRRLTVAVRRQAEGGYADELELGLEPSTGGDEVAELGRAFAAAGREVRAQLADKDRRDQALRGFVADTTHDVMIPLTVLQGHLATLRDRAATGEGVDALTLGSAMQEAHYIASLLHNLATVAALEAEHPTLQRSAIDLGESIQRVTARHRPIGEQLGVALECSVPDPPRSIDADLTMLEQALGNLVYNAVRHNERGGHVAIYADDGEPDRFVIHVVDDGPGIGEETLASLRQRGARGDQARTRAPGGRGLGLDITARVCELHGFSLHLDPREGGGLHARIEGPSRATDR